MADKTMTDEQKKQSAERMRKYQASKSNWDTLSSKNF